MTAYILSPSPLSDDVYLTGESVTIHIDQVRSLAQCFQDRAIAILAEIGVKHLNEEQLLSVRDGDGAAGDLVLLFFLLADLCCRCFNDPVHRCQHRDVQP